MKRALLLAALGAGCAPMATSAAPEPITGGAIDDGDPAVMLVSNGSGTCTGTLVSPHVVLTARHCLVPHETGDVLMSPSSVRVFVGTGPRFDRFYDAAALYVVPGSTTAAIDLGAPDDLGLVVLDRAATETPLTMDRLAPDAIVGQTITAVGFGVTPTEAQGTKRHVETHVDAYRDRLLWTPPSVCPGDSGGPAIGPNGHVWAVAVLYFTPGGGPLVCGTSIGGYNPIDAHRDWIDSVLEIAGDLCVPDPEICDGLDNDCDGVIDPGCLDDGAPCTDASVCLSGRCEDTAAGRVCTRACDVAQIDGCGDGLRCVHTSGCDGLCVPGVGTLPNESACTDDGACVSGHCVDPGDGRRRCLDACLGDAGRCVSGEACTGAPGACGACVAEAILGSPRGLGEECASDDACRSGHCVVTRGVGECASPCAMPSECPSGFACEAALCVRDRAQPLGGTCEATRDCASGRCAMSGERGWCSVDDCHGAPCGHGFSCVDAGDAAICVPTLALTGEACGSDADCALGTCVGGACSVSCASPSDCGPGLRCARDGASTHCVRPTSQAGGCAVGLARHAGPPVVPTLSFLVLLVLGRPGRRRARGVSSAEG